jgi:hypothetical protein
MKYDINEVPNACSFCRKLIKENPNFPEIIYLYRGDMLCLTVDVAKAAKFRLDENTLRYIPYDAERYQRLRTGQRKPTTEVTDELF